MLKTYETQDYLKQAYEKGGFFCNFSTIFQVSYNNGSKQYSFFPVFKKMKGAKVGFSKRGYCNFIDKETAERWGQEYAQKGQGVYC